MPWHLRQLVEMILRLTPAVLRHRVERTPGLGTRVVWTASENVVFRSTSSRGPSVMRPNLNTLGAPTPRAPSQSARPHRPEAAAVALRCSSIQTSSPPDRQPALAVYDYGTGSKTLGFYTRQRYTNVESLESVDIRRQDCFIVTNDSQLGDVMQAFPEARVIAHATGTASNRLAVRLMHANFGRNVELTGLYLIRTGESETR